MLQSDIRIFQEISEYTLLVDCSDLEDDVSLKWRWPLLANRLDPEGKSDYSYNESIFERALDLLQACNSWYPKNVYLHLD